MSIHWICYWPNPKHKEPEMDGYCPNNVSFIILVILCEFQKYHFSLTKQKFENVNETRIIFLCITKLTRMEEYKYNREKKVLHENIYRFH